MMPSRDSSFELVPAHLRIYLPVMIRVCAQLVKDNEKGVATSAPTRKMIAMIYGEWSIDEEQAVETQNRYGSDGFQHRSPMPYKSARQLEVELRANMKFQVYRMIFLNSRNFRRLSIIKLIGSALKISKVDL